VNTLGVVLLVTLGLLVVSAAATAYFVLKFLWVLRLSMFGSFLRTTQDDRYTLFENKRQRLLPPPTEDRPKGRPKLTVLKGGLDE